jgi:hypothetical protein
MSAPEKPKDSRPKDYEIGFGRPPAASRFKPGNDAARKSGRPRKKRTVGQLIEGALMTKVTVTERGRPKTMTAQEVIFRKLTLDAVNGDKRAIQTLFSLRDRYQDGDEMALDIADLQGDDRKILDEYFEALQRNGVGGSLSSAPGSAARDEQPTTPDDDETPTTLNKTEGGANE